MKKTISLALAVITAALLSFSSGAAILYEDTFDDFNEEFWEVTGTHFEADNGVLSGWEDAVAHQSHSDWSNQTWGAFRQYTAWIDVRISDEGLGDIHQAGLWYTNIYDYQIGYLSAVERYKVMYRGDDSTAYLLIETTRKGKKIPEDGVLASLKLEDEPGMNITGDPVRLGLRVEDGKITAYANGLVIGEHSYTGIGKDYSAMILWNDGCYVEFDNFAVGDLDEDVAVRTRPYGYVPELYAITVAGGTATADSAAPGETVTVSAEVPEGKFFDGWELVSGEGIGEDLLAEREFTFEMPACDIELRAKFRNAAGDVNGDGKLNSRDVVAIMKAALPGFVPSGNFSAEAADLNGDGKVNSRDVIALMKLILTQA